MGMTDIDTATRTRKITFAAIGTALVAGLAVTPAILDAQAAPAAPTYQPYVVDAAQAAAAEQDAVQHSLATAYAVATEKANAAIAAAQGTLDRHLAKQRKKAAKAAARAARAAAGSIADGT